MIVGLTGSIGSGKTTVAAFLELLNIPIYYSDQRANVLMNHDPQIKRDLINYFGAEIFEKGSLNKKELSQRIFYSDKDLEFVNSLVHPVVRLDFKAWCKANAHRELCIIETALLFESEIIKDVDTVLLIAAPLQIRLARVIARDGCSQEQALTRMAKQPSDVQLQSVANYEIKSDNTQFLIPQILKWLHTL